jgi:methenyltetrahydromethanopterin cyclohydrolase
MTAPITHAPSAAYEIRLNEQAYGICKSAMGHADGWRIGVHSLTNGATVLDFGVHVDGGILAGQNLARICMSDRVKITPHPADYDIGPWPLIQVATDDPVHACMASQYAGWPVQKDEFFAMGSGPMRIKRGKEHVLQHLGVTDPSPHTVGVLECDKLPDESVCESIAAECKTSVQQLVLCVAPTRSIAGTVQVVARSVETSMHKLFELGFDLRSVVSGYGSAPLPPPIPDFVQGIGRTNDAILYGGHVTLWVRSQDDLLQKLGPKIPSFASKDFGLPFAQTFKKYNYDFYQVDPGLFSPAMITLVNLTSGNSFRFGGLRPCALFRRTCYAVPLAVSFAPGDYL